MLKSAYFVGTEPPMKKVEDYKRHAEECRAMARVTANEEQGRGLFTMAETWDGLGSKSRDAD